MSGAVRVEIVGKPLRCQHCGAGAFHEKTTALDRLALGGLFRFEGWWGHQATIYVCASCGFLHWFLAYDAAYHEAERAEEPAEPVACLSCGGVIPEGASACPDCGWSWESTS